MNAVTTTIPSTIPSLSTVNSNSTGLNKALILANEDVVVYDLAALLMDNNVSYIVETELDDIKRVKVHFRDGTHIDLLCYEDVAQYCRDATGDENKCRNACALEV